MQRPVAAYSLGHLQHCIQEEMLHMLTCSKVGPLLAVNKKCGLFLAGLLLGFLPTFDLTTYWGNMTKTTVDKVWELDVGGSLPQSGFRWPIHLGTANLKFRLVGGQCLPSQGLIQVSFVFLPNGSVFFSWTLQKQTRRRSRRREQDEEEKEEEEEAVFLPF